MNTDSGTSRPLLREIRVTNLLSFGPGAVALPMQSLNVFIGPNGSGKSNLIEALALMRATAVLPHAAGDGDVRGVVRRGGGAGEWIWKGAPGKPAVVQLVIEKPLNSWRLRHRFAFHCAPHGFELDDEIVANARMSPVPFYEFRNGDPVSYSLTRKEAPRGRSGAKMELRTTREALNLGVSVLAQRRDPERYPQITHLAETYEDWRIYREWAFGRNTVFRQPQRADARNDRLEEDFSNLGLFLSRLRKKPKAKQAVLMGLRDLYDGLTDFESIVEGGTVQVFFTEGDFSIPATRLSDGTLRYLCLLAILCDPDPPSLICIEEPELGLHPDILPKLADHLVEASGRTQLIVTTHSDILVDAMTERPQSVVVCEKHEGRTAMKRLDAAELTDWLGKYRLGQLWTKGQIGGTRW